MLDMIGGGRYHVRSDWWKGGIMSDLNGGRWCHVGSDWWKVKSCWI